jgi:hypothetical protein
MKTVAQPVAKTRLTLPNGVRLVTEAYPSVIRSSNRVDSKVVALDWESVYVQIKLDCPCDLSGILATFEVLDVWGGRECIEDNREAIKGLSEGLGSADYVDTMLASVYKAYDEVMSKK